MAIKVRLVGVAGHVAGEELVLEYGKKVTVGRSRSADWSLVRMKSWTAKSEADQKADDAFRTVSGKHFEITMFNLGSIEIVGLSRNGTQLDGKPVTRATVTDVTTAPHELRFGADEVLRLETVKEDEKKPGDEAAEKAPEKTPEKATEKTTEQAPEKAPEKAADDAPAQPQS
jgi:pSer/pThr/pTyr-binding forkhead associated (FHA) protein